MPRTKVKKPTLKVLFDSSAIHVGDLSIGSATDLVKQEVVELIADSHYPDLHISWHIPSVVRHEREHQMRKEALKLRKSIDRIERLLGHALTLTDDILLGRVSRAVEESIIKLGIVELHLDSAQVDWKGLVEDAAYRRAPFQEGEKEKGFRDAVVRETFCQLVDSSPSTPTICRLALVTADILLTESVNARLFNSSNVTVVSSIADLKGLINTLVSNVGQDFIARLKPKAAKLFFEKESKDGLFYTADVRTRLSDEFGNKLVALPEGTSFRRNGTWYINSPNFLKKNGRTIYWATQIEVEYEAGVKQPLPAQPIKSGNFALTPIDWSKIDLSALTPTVSLAGASGISIGSPPLAGDLFVSPNSFAINPNALNLGFGATEKQVVTVKGRDVYEVTWTTMVTMANDLKKPAIQAINHIELTTTSDG